MHYWKAAGVLSALCLIDVVSAKHVKRDQIIMAPSRNDRVPKLSKHRHAAEGSFLMNVTFDGIDMSKEANHTLTSIPFLNFEKYQIVNSTAATASGMLNETDIDCAESSPNFALAITSKYQAPSIFHTDEDSLAAAGLSKYMDLISFTLKPRHPGKIKAQIAQLDIAAWTIDGNDVLNVQELYVGWWPDEETGGFNPFPLEPRAIFDEPWGEKVNWIEMSAAIFDEDDNLVPWEFCLDNINFEVREKSKG